MPSGPKWNGLNRHAQEAADREQQKRSEAKARDAQAREDASWGDDRDTKQKRADERKEDQQRKEDEQRRKRAERDAEYAAELRSVEKAPPKKVVLREMQKEVTRGAVTGSLKRGTDVNDIEAPNNRPTCTENVQSGTTQTNAARSAVPEDRHIGKRARVAYRKFCDVNLPSLKDGHSGKALRRSQLNDLLWAMWQKSPENPFVVRAENRAEEALRRKWFEDDDEETSESDAA